jgi:acetylornithine deacetylase/succinyl-diaminopimelate desuccinylase-like protein
MAPGLVSDLFRSAENRRDEAVAFCLELGNLPDLCGDERAVAETLFEGYRLAGLEPRLQPISEHSANVLATWPGRDPSSVSAQTLILNSHLDTEGELPSGQGEQRLRLRGTWREDDLLIGKGLVNAKVHLVAQLYAVRSLQDLGLVPINDVILTGTAQETGTCRTGRPDTDAWAGPHDQEGVGARWLVDHGVVADYALVGEPTGFAICTAQAGYLRLRIGVTGDMPYTPFIHRGRGGQDSPNPFERAAPVITAISRWAERYAHAYAHDVAGGRVVPKAQVMQVRSAFPAFTEYRDRCDIFVDVRTPPGAAAMAVKRDLMRELAGNGHDVSVDCYDYRRGYAAVGAEQLIAALDAAHRAVFGAEPQPPEPAQMSMWQDTNAFNEVGIPAVSYGIGVRAEQYTRERRRALHVDDLTALVKVYAYAIADVCGAENGTMPR